MRRPALALAVCLLLAGFSEAQTAEEFYKKGIALKDEKKPKEAIVALKEATDLDPGYAAAWYELGWCSNDTKDYLGAIGYLRKALPKWSDIPKVHFELGYAFEKTEKYDSALAHLNRCIELKPDYSLAHKELGNIAYTKEEYPAALESYKKYETYAKTAIKDYLYWYRRGFVNNALKNYSDAIESLEKSKAIKSDYINTHLELGFANSRLKQNDIAIGHYNDAIALDPKSHIGYNGIGEVYRDNIKNIDEAMEWYMKSLNINPKERKANFGMGYCLNSQGKYSDAVPYLTTAIEQEPTYTAAYVELGYTHYRLGNYATGLENMKKALKINPANENARYYSGLIYIAQNNRSMAQKMVDELKAMSSKNAAGLQEKVNKM